MGAIWDVTKVIFGCAVATVFGCIYGLIGIGLAILGFFMGFGERHNLSNVWRVPFAMAAEGASIGYSIITGSSYDNE